MELSMLELWSATGPLARGVVVLLGGMSVVAGAIVTEKWLRLRRAEQESDEFLSAWRQADADAASVRVIAERFPASPVAGLVRAVTSAANADDTHRAEVHDRVVRRFVLTTGSQLRRGLSTVATVGSTAPFVGLFGTVIGIVNAFHEIGATGRGGIATVSTGIAEALVTTAFGIIVAIPAVWLFNALSQRIGRLLVTVESAGEELAVVRLVAPTPRAQDGGASSWR
ncbi:MAG: MotA/TolQ/ExbB proton channel family protein [Candidatus Binatia bacterium]